MKILLFFVCFLLISSNVLSKSITIQGKDYKKAAGSSGYYIGKDFVTEGHTGAWGDFAKEEFFNGNYGLSKDMFKIIAAKDAPYPPATYFLGEIYSSIGIFKNIKLAKDYYIKFVNDKRNKNIVTTQDAYIKLSKLETKTDDKLKYAHKAKEIRETKSSLTNIYQINKDLYDKTKKEEYKKTMNLMTQKIRKFEAPSYLKSVSFDKM